MKKSIRYIAIALVVTCSACTDTPDRVNLITNSKNNPIIIPPNCPDWSTGSNINYGNTKSSNYGCATITNFGEMIEDPNDMITGKSTRLTNGARSGLPVSAYERSIGGVGGGQ